MKRLIYAPKAYIFIRSSNLDGRIYDVTSDVVRGEVTQNLGDVSKARFELRNRYQKWIRDPDNKWQSIFLPMDMVTIWLQRISGRPIQVFTGYLDSVPYYQGYPGNAVFEATCTLKKLAFTWFDPGLSFFQQWIMSTGGWTYDQTTGEATNPTYISQRELITGDLSDALAQNGALATVNDGGFAELLGRFMVEVAGWDTNDVLVSELPKDLPKLAAKLYLDIHKKTQPDIENLQRFLAQAMGVQGWAQFDSTTNSDGSTTQNPRIISVINQMKTITDKNNIPLIVPLLAAYILTNCDPKFSVDPNLGFSNWGYGIFALQPPISAQPVPGITSDPFGTLTTSSLIDGKTPADLADVAVSTDVFCARLKKTESKYLQGAQNNDLTAIQNWIRAALGRDLPNVDMTTIFNKVKQYASINMVVTPPTDSPSANFDPANFDWNSTQLQNLLSATDQQVLRNYYSNSNKWLAALLYQAKQISRSISLSPLGFRNASVLMLSGPPADLKKFFNSLVGISAIDSVDMVIDGKRQMLKQGVASNVSNAQPAPGNNNVMSILQSQAPSSSVTPTGATTGQSLAASDPSSQQGYVPFTSLAAFSANAAFAANFAFPANAQESMFLTGDKALMNDVSCLDAVKQFAKASLRTFRSLPDGRFLAFYPDYFGAYRKPYWQIYDIEITNFGIQLNDDALATHVYVVGDTTMGDGSIDVWDEVASRGVATITQAFMLNSFIQPYTPPADPNAPFPDQSIGRLHDAYTFLQHYGARPHKEEEPLIRNTFYEFLMAWQRFMQLWSQQFSTTVSFTFQPEVMAGGLIEFPNHDIQMFCESATHTFDYEGGFETTAVLSAPALTKTNNDPTQMPGFALAGGVNTVGVG